MSIAEIIQFTGLKMTQFAKKYNIPYRTLQSWTYDERTCPEYTRALLERVVKLDFATASTQQ